MKKLLFSAALAFITTASFAQTAAGEKYDPIRVCVIQDDELKEILAYYDKNTGTTYVDRDGELITLENAFPLENGYSADKTWYINNDEIKAFGKTYVKYGLPRVLSVTDVEKVGLYDKVGLYAETTAGETPEILYLPVRPGCEFQPYQILVENDKIAPSKRAPQKKNTPPKK